MTPVTADRSARERLIEELTQERYAPLLPPPPTRHQRARQTPIPQQPARRPTGTGWPG